MIWSLQVLRFVAALMVVYVHAAQIAFAATGSAGSIPQSMALVGQSGVDIFFVLSGVIIAKTAPGLTSLEFAWRRFRRVVPIYLLACVPATIIAAKSGFESREIVATFLLWPATDRMAAPILPVAWTLCFEMLFYAAAALVLADRRWIYVLVALFLTAFMMRPSGPLFQFLGNPLIIEFLFGVGLAHTRGRRWGIWALPAGVVALLTVGALGAAPDGGTIESLIGEQAIYRVVVYGLPAALIVYGTMQIATKQSAWTYLGDASYTLYLVHTFAVSALLTLWLVYPLPPDLIIAATMAASVLLAWRVYERVERPLLNALRKVRIPTKPGLADTRSERQYRNSRI